MNLQEACAAFLEQDVDALVWGGEPHQFTDAPDCDVMAKRFAAFVENYPHHEGYGVPERVEVVKVAIEATYEGCTDVHWFTVIDGVAVDWTARQFHNIAGVNLDASEIPSPLLFLWPGEYPLPTITAQEAS